MLTDKVALVTGVGRGIGKEMAKALARDGATVIVDYNSSAAKAEETVAETAVAGDKAKAVRCDVFNFGKSGELMDYAVKTYGKLDILMNNAGITRDGLLMKMSEADSDTVINTDLEGAFNCMQYVARQIVKQKGGRIIGIAFVVGVMGNAGQVNYAAPRTRVIGVTKSAAREMVSRGTTINAIAPRFVVAEMTGVLSDAVRDAIEQQTPTKAFGRASDVVEMTAFLASEKTRYITSQVISVDGGIAM